jgi:hypothetical protein
MNSRLTVSLNPPTRVLCLLRQFGFVMGAARGEAHKPDCNGPLPATLRAGLRSTEPFAEPDPETEPEAEPEDAAEPATKTQVAEAVAAAAAADGGSHAPCKRQRGGEPDPGAGFISGWSL